MFVLLLTIVILLEMNMSGSYTNITNINVRFKNITFNNNVSLSNYSFNFSGNYPFYDKIMSNLSRYFNHSDFNYSDFKFNESFIMYCLPFYNISSDDNSTTYIHLENGTRLLNLDYGYIPIYNESLPIDKKYVQEGKLYFCYDKNYKPTTEWSHLHTIDKHTRQKLGVLYECNMLCRLKFWIKNKLQLLKVIGERTD